MSRLSLETSKSMIRPRALWLAMASAALLLGPLAAASLASDAVGAADAPAPIQSMSALAFGPDGLLFIGDAKAGAIIAIETGDTTLQPIEGRISITDIETKIAAMLGTRASEVLIHDLAVNPASNNIYLAVSRSRGRWESRWQLPNDLADADLLLRVAPDGTIDAVDFTGLSWSQAALPNPVDATKNHRWKRGVSLRTDTITDLAWDHGTVWVAGLSNEEFASALWRVGYPFDGDAASQTTVEIFHGAHGEWETHAPIRTFVPYALGEKHHLLAAYLCTPLVTFETDALADGSHVKGRTVAEFGAGNYPLDMVVYTKGDTERLLIANSNLPLMIVDPADVAGFDGAITEEVEGYTAGVPYEIRSSNGVQQLDLLAKDWIVALQRLPGGTMDLVTLPTARF